MSGCIDRKYENLLYPYELEMLSEEERREFELHMMECEHCFGKAKEFDPYIEMISRDPAIRDSIARMSDETAIEGYEPAQSYPPSSFKSKKRSFAYVAVAVAAAVLFLIFRPWKIEIEPTQEAFAHSKRLAVVYFNNLVEPDDPGNMGRIASTLLLTDLSDSDYFRVVSSQRIYDILRQLGKDTVKVVDAENASVVAQKAGAFWMVVGSIVQIDPGLAITTELVDVESGDVISSQRVVGDNDDDLFSVIDKLTIQVKRGLPVSEDIYEEQDRMVADVTTHSQDAYGHYIEGVDNFHKFYYPDAEKSFKKALEYDSTFAMAYYYLSIVSEETYLEKAIAYSAGSTKREQSYIKIRELILQDNDDGAIEELNKLLRYYPDEKEAYFWLGWCNYHLVNDIEEAIRYFSEAVALDPFYKNAYNMLGYSYDKTGQKEPALKAIEKYVSLAPDEANPHDTYGEFLAKYGKLDKAIESYKKAVTIKPDFYASLLDLGILYIFKEKYEEADSCFRHVAKSCCIDQVSGWLFLATVPFHQGKFKDALVSADAGIEKARKNKFESSVPSFNRLKGLIYREMDDYDSAINEMLAARKYIEKQFPENIINVRPLYIQLLVEKGEIAEAETECERLRVDSEVAGLPMAFYQYSLGCVELAKGNTRTAVKAIERVADDSPENDRVIVEALTLGRALAGLISKTAIMKKRLTFWKARCPSTIPCALISPPGPYNCITIWESPMRKPGK
jgi:tetratricopeptide (TPR) repeat protein